MSRGFSLQRRLMWLVLSVVVVAWLLAVGATWQDARHELDELLDSHLAQAAALLIAQQGGGVDEEEKEDAPLLHRYAAKVAFQVFHEGRLTTRSANAPDYPLVESDDSLKRGFVTVQHDGQAWRVFVAHGGKDDIKVYVGERMESRQSISFAVLRSAMWPLGVALPLLAFAVWAALRHGLAPLRELSAALSWRKPETLEPVPLEGMPSEMLPAVRALNSLFDRISSLIDNERRFTSDAAHELRTPIAAIRAQAQVALAALNDEQREKALKQTLAGCDRASHLINQLLTLSRLEAGTQPKLSSVDLASLCRSVVGEMAPHAIKKGQSLEYEGMAECQVLGDVTLLAVLMRNLVDNALRYSGPKATVAVRLEGAAGSFSLLVEDSGAGLTTGERAQLGVRFHRKSGTQESGSGLGWSICQRVCLLHGFTLTAEESPRLGGLLVRVTGKLIGA